MDLCVDWIMMIRMWLCTLDTINHAAFNKTAQWTSLHAPKLSRCAQAHSLAHSQVHSPEATHYQSHLTICSHACLWVLHRETCWVAAATHREADGGRQVAGCGWREAGGGGPNHDCCQSHSLNPIFSTATATRSHHASLSWCWTLLAKIQQERQTIGSSGEHISDSDIQVGSTADSPPILRIYMCICGRRWWHRHNVKWFGSHNRTTQQLWTATLIFPNALRCSLIGWMQRYVLWGTLRLLYQYS